jgi:hypothetical protein
MEYDRRKAITVLSKVQNLPNDNGIPVLVPKNL